VTPLSRPHYTEAASRLWATKRAAQVESEGENTALLTLNSTSAYPRRRHGLAGGLRPRPYQRPPRPCTTRAARILLLCTIATFRIISAKIHNCGGPQPYFEAMKYKVFYFCNFPPLLLAIVFPVLSSSSAAASAAAAAAVVMRMSRRGKGRRPTTALCAPG
jgi:hypothetical protein